MSFTSEFEHGIGYSCTNRSSLHVLNGAKHIVYPQGASIVIRGFDDPHDQSFLRGHNFNVNCIAYSARGRFLASGDVGRESDIVVWDLETKEEMWRFTEHDSGVEDLSFSHDERLLLIIGFDRRMSIFDMKTGMLLNAVDIPKSLGRVSCGTWGGFVKDLKRRNTEMYQFATAGDTVALWSLNPFTGALSMCEAESRRTTRQSHCLTFLHLPDAAGREGYFDEFLIAGTQSGDFISFHVKPNKEVIGGTPNAVFSSAITACSGGVVSVASNRMDETLLLIGGGDGTVALFKFHEGNSTWVDIDGTKLTGPVHGLSFSPCGKEIVAGTKSGQVVRARTGSLSNATVTVSSNPCGSLTGISFAPDSNDTFATSSDDGMIRVWSIEDYSVLMETTDSGAGHPTCIHFGIEAVLSGWTDGCVRSHHASTGELLWKIKDAHPSGVSALRISNNMRFVVTGGEDGAVRVWELRMRQLVSHLKEHSSRVNAIVMFDDDAHCISCSRDKSFLTWDLRNDKRISAHTQRMGGINAIALNRDQNIVITMGQERTISFWDLRESYPVLSIQNPHQGMHLDEATSIAVSNSGRLFATGGADAIVKLWYIDNDEPVLLQDNIGHTSAVTGMSFTADDKQLVSIGNDGAVFVWNIFPDFPQESKK